MGSSLGWPGFHSSVRHPAHNQKRHSPGFGLKYFIAHSRSLLLLFLARRDWKTSPPVQNADHVTIFYVYTKLCQLYVYRKLYPTWSSALCKVRSRWERFTLIRIAIPSLLPVRLWGFSIRLLQLICLSPSTAESFSFRMILIFAMARDKRLYWIVLCASSSFHILTVEFRKYDCKWWSVPVLFFFFSFAWQVQGSLSYARDNILSIVIQFWRSCPCYHQMSRNIFRILHAE